MQSILRPEWSRKMRFFSFISMMLLVYVHGYDLNDRYLQPFTPVLEKMTGTAFFEYLTANGLFRFRIPMLFAISGYLLALADHKGYWKVLGRRFRTLAVPYFLWSAIGALIAFSLFHWSFTHASVLNTHMQPTGKNWDQFGWREWRDTILSTNVSYQLWFLRSLFLLNLIYPLLRYLVRRAPVALFTFIALLWFSTPASPLQIAMMIAGEKSQLTGVLQHFQGPWGIFLDGEGLLPFCLGIWLCKRGKDLSLAPRWFSLKVFAVVFVVLAVTKTCLAFQTGLFPNIYVPGIIQWFLHKWVIVTGMLVAWYGSGRLVNWCLQQRWFRHMSDQTFMIYALHVPLVTYLIDPVHGLLQPFRYYRMTTYLLLPLAIILAATAVGMLLKAVAPPLFGILTGDRGLKPMKVPDPEPPAVNVAVVTAAPQPSAT
ncbi:MAG: acyltransferase [Chitinophagaceae bacterium]|nr:MAG: acyltransferase [Chitinophagaceae bacterium]